LSMHPFSLVPAYRAIHHLPLPERIERMRDGAVRAAILAGEPDAPKSPLFGYVRNFAIMFEMGETLDYEPVSESSIASRAAALGVSPQELAYDLLLEHGDSAALYSPLANYAHGNLDTTLELLRHDSVIPGLGDGGAHYGVICDASYST